VSVTFGPLILFVHGQLMSGSRRPLKKRSDQRAQESTSRRAILASAAAGAAALAAASLPSTQVRGASGDNLILGQSNTATTATTLAASVLDNLHSALGVSTSNGHAFDAETADTTAGAAIQAHGPAGGLLGENIGASEAPGVAGGGPQGVRGYGGTGVAGFGGTVVPSTTPSGVGVYGKGDVTGVRGTGPVGVDAGSVSGKGLERQVAGTGARTATSHRQTPATPEHPASGKDLDGKTGCAGQWWSGPARDGDPFDATRAPFRGRNGGARSGPPRRRPPPGRSPG
jgi:hypothetical protein